MQELATGNLAKMTSELAQPVQYTLPVNESSVAMNQLIGQEIQLHYTGLINCIACGRKTSKSFNQGYCYPCFRRLPECDSCIVKPELCHYAEGTCRDPSWGEQHCMQPHVVYLANSSGLKVGITRGSQIPTRWIDQGATQAIPIFKVRDRLTSGLVEVICKQHVADKTDWRKMLKNNADEIDLLAERERLRELVVPELEALRERLDIDAIVEADEKDIISIEYPVEIWPAKVTAINLDKTPTVSGILQGIKGQYLILDSGVINIRKYGGYHVQLSA